MQGVVRHEAHTWPFSYVLLGAQARCLIGNTKSWITDFFFPVAVSRGGSVPNGLRRSALPGIPHPKTVLVRTLKVRLYSRYRYGCRMEACCGRGPPAFSPGWGSSPELAHISLQIWSSSYYCTYTDCCVFPAWWGLVKPEVRAIEVSHTAFKVLRFDQVLHLAAVCVCVFFFIL